MKYHHPSFLWELQRRFDITFNVYDHHFIVYLITDNKYFTAEILQNIISEALQDALCAPQDPPSRAPCRDLFPTPPRAHLDALHRALCGRDDYLKKRTILTGAGEKFEWQVDCQVIRRIVADVRLAEDVLIALQMIGGDLFVSERLLKQKFWHTHGRALSDHRLREILYALEDAQFVKGNGHTKTYGRDILQ
jgi:hypothetical protein